MVSREIRATEEVMPELKQDSMKDVCRTLPAVRRTVNKRGAMAFMRDDPEMAALLANEATFLKRWQGTCRSTAGRRRKTARRKPRYRGETSPDYIR